jgi:hypothetical protein
MARANTEQPRASALGGVPSRTRPERAAEMFFDSSIISGRTLLYASCPGGGHNRCQGVYQSWCLVGIFVDGGPFHVGDPLVNQGAPKHSLNGRNTNLHNKNTKIRKTDSPMADAIRTRTIGFSVDGGRAGALFHHVPHEHHQSACGGRNSDREHWILVEAMLERSSTPHPPCASRAAPFMKVFNPVVLLSARRSPIVTFDSLRTSHLSLLTSVVGSHRESQLSAAHRWSEGSRTPHFARAI